MDALVKNTPFTDARRHLMAGCVIVESQPDPCDPPTGEIPDRGRRSLGGDGSLHVTQRRCIIVDGGSESLLQQFSGRVRAAPACACISLCRLATLWDVRDASSRVTALIPDQTGPRGEVLSQRADINLPERLQLRGSSAGNKCKAKRESAAATAAATESLLLWGNG